MELRRYQKDIISYIRSQITQGNKRILIAAPTGSGKTIISRYIANSSEMKNNRVLFTVHRRKLAEQTLEKFKPLETSLIMADDPRYKAEAKIQIGTIHSIYNRDIIKPDVIIIDEVHYGTQSDMIQTLFKRFPDSIFIGLSATPIGIDGYLIEGFDCIYQDLTIKKLVEQNHLVPSKNYGIQIDLSSVPTSNYEYNQTKLVEKINKKEIVSNIVAEWKRLGENRKTLAFCQDIKHACNLKEQFLEKDIKAGVVHSDMRDHQIKAVFKQFKNEEIKVLCSVSMITEGFDDIDVGALILGRATKIRRTYIQMVGRGFRVGKYDDCIILDAGNNFEEHGLPQDAYFFKFKPSISETADKIIERAESANHKTQIERKKIFLKRIHSLLDLYANKQYRSEQELLEDVRKFLRKTTHMHYRQNSGKAYLRGSWVHFTDIKGLPDITLCFNPLLDIRVELKHPKKGNYRQSQQETIYNLHCANHLAYYAESVADIAEILMHIEENIIVNKDGMYVSNNIYRLPERQKKLFRKYKTNTPQTGE